MKYVVFSVTENEDNKEDLDYVGLSARKTVTEAIEELVDEGAVYPSSSTRLLVFKVDGYYKVGMDVTKET